jgi:N-acetylglucosaminyl-diphospho-decaprenol L-rhamnosyltransferase
MTVTHPAPARAPAVPHVTAVIVSWNTAELLDLCLRSIADHGPSGATLDVVVVDNASDDDSVAMVRERWPDATVIENSENEGFCRANNRAIRASTGDWLLLINADAMLLAGSLDALLARGATDPRAGIVAPRLVCGDGSWQRWTAGRAPTLASVGSYLFGLDRLESRFPRLGGTYLGVDTDQAFQPEWVSSAAMLVRREMLDEIGLLDESIFVYMDDVELCQRAREHGWHVWYEAGVDVVHLMGQSTKRATGRPSTAALRGFNRYFRARHGPVQETVLRGMQAVGYGARVAVYRTLALRDPTHRRRAQADAHLVHLNVTLGRTENRA